MTFCKKLFPKDIGEGMVAALERTAADRNELLIVGTKDTKGKIGVTYQVDDPTKPGIFKIDIDAPAPAESEFKDVFLSRLEIDLETGEMELFPNGYTPSKKYPLESHHEVLVRMSDVIWKN